MSNYRLALAAMLVLAALAACSQRRIMDRHDEAALSLEEARRNLYRGGGAATVERVGHDGIPVDETTALYAYEPLAGLRPLAADDAELPATYAALSISWADGPPVLRFYQRLFAEDAIAFTCPIDPRNSRLAAADEVGEEIEVFVALRQGTWMPWVVMDDYEIFRILVRRRFEDKRWEIKEVGQLTDNRVEDIQPTVSPDGGHLALVRIEDGAPNLVLMKLPPASVPGGGGDVAAEQDSRQFPEGGRIVAANADLPFFLPDSSAVVFVRRGGEIADFMVYDLAADTERPAAEAEVRSVVRAMPHSAIRANYLLLVGFRGGAEPADGAAPPAVFAAPTFRELALTALRQSPAILRDFYALRSALADGVHNLYDEGPDFFFAGHYMAAENILVPFKEDVPIQDRIATENFLRLVSGMSVPVIPNVPLRLATIARDRWEAEARRQRLHKTINETIAALAVAYFDYVEWAGALPMYRRLVDINRRRLEISRLQASLDYVLDERSLQAENTLQAALSDYNNALESLVAAQYRVAALLGWNPDGEILPVPPPSGVVGNAPREWEVPGLEWFEARAMINQPDIQRVDFMALRAAAIRDMGPPATRADPVRFRLSYGLGILNWSEFVDDFLQLGLEYAMPLRLPIVGNAYYDAWAAEIASLRQEKYRVQGEVRVNVHEAWKDLSVLGGQLRTLESRTDFHVERARISGIHAEFGRLEAQDGDRPIFDNPANESAAVADKLLLWRSQCDYFRRLAKLYAAAGIAPELLPSLFAATDPVVARRGRESRGLFLWRSLEVVGDRASREEFLKFCAKHNIDKVYVFVSRTPEGKLFLDEYYREFQYFVAECRRRGIEPHAMMGEVEWLEEYMRDEIAALLESLRGFNERCAQAGGAGFAGLNLDIEPHAIPAWHDDPEARAELTRQYLDVLAYVRGIRGRAGLSADISYNYLGSPVPDSPRDLVAHIAEQVEILTIMSYLNRSELVIGKVLPFLEREDLRGTGVEFALETAPLDEDYLSFHGTSMEKLIGVAAESAAEFRRFPNFLGLMIHDYTHAKKLADPGGEK